MGWENLDVSFARKVRRAAALGPGARSRAHPADRASARPSVLADRARAQPEHARQHDRAGGRRPGQARRVRADVGQADPLLRVRKGPRRLPGARARALRPPPPGGLCCADSPAREGRPPASRTVQATTEAPYGKLVECLANYGESQAQLNILQLLNSLARSASPDQMDKLMVSLEAAGGLKSFFVRRVPARAPPHRPGSTASGPWRACGVRACPGCSASRKRSAPCRPRRTPPTSPRRLTPCSS